MTPSRPSDTLDAAIDRTAARMVAVPEDPEMVTRIVSVLPDRSSRLAWLVPQFAALSAIVVAAVLWSTRERPEAPAPLPAVEIAGMTSLPGVITAQDPGTHREPGTEPSEPFEPSEPSEPSEPLKSDFERSLPALEIVGSLMVSDVTPSALPASPALELAPIGVADLPLTAESFPPKDR